MRKPQPQQQSGIAESHCTPEQIVAWSTPGIRSHDSYRPNPSLCFPLALFRNAGNCGHHLLGLPSELRYPTRHLFPIALVFFSKLSAQCRFLIEEDEEVGNQPEADQINRDVA